MSVCVCVLKTSSWYTFPCEQMKEVMDESMWESKDATSNV